MKETPQEGISFSTTLLGAAGLVGLMTFGVVIVKLFF
jgi:hypothetical protein